MDIGAAHAAAAARRAKALQQLCLELPVLRERLETLYRDVFMAERELAGHDGPASDGEPGDGQEASPTLPRVWIEGRALHDDPQGV